MSESRNYCQQDLSVYIAWYLTLVEMKVPQKEIDEIIWKLNEKITDIIPLSLMHLVGNSYLPPSERSQKNI